MASKLRQYFGNAPIKLIAVILFAIFVPSVLVTALGLVAVFQAQSYVRDGFAGPARERVEDLHSRLGAEWNRRLELYASCFQDAGRRRDFLGDIRDRDPSVLDVLVTTQGSLSLVPEPPPLRLWTPDSDPRLKDLHRLEHLTKDYPAALAACRKILDSSDDDAVIVDVLLAAARISYKLGDKAQSLSYLRAAHSRFGNTTDSTGVVRAIPLLVRIAELERELNPTARPREVVRELASWMERCASRMDPEVLTFFRERASSLVEGGGEGLDPSRGRRLSAAQLPSLEPKLPRESAVQVAGPVHETHTTLAEIGECDFVSFVAPGGGIVVHLLIDRGRFLADATRLCAEVGLPVEGLSVETRGRAATSSREIARLGMPTPFSQLELRYVSVGGLLPQGFRGFGVLSLATFTWAVIVLVLTIVLGVLFTVRSVLRELKTARLKSDFVSFITHELKTPLTAIRTLTETMLAGRIDTAEENQLCIQMIGSETERLAKLVEQVLEYSKIERHEKQFRFTSCDMEGVVREAVRLFDEHNRANPREIEVNSAQHISKIKMDRAAMIELLLNLLSNAAKYSSPGKKIIINLRESIDEICVEVIDKGIGIRKRDQKKIFEKFFRAEDYLTREVEGTGLGLTFAKYIAKVHNGDIKVASQLSTGSTFTLQLRKTHILAE